MQWKWNKSCLRELENSFPPIPYPYLWAIYFLKYRRIYDEKMAILLVFWTIIFSKLRFHHFCVLYSPPFFCFSSYDLHTSYTFTPTCPTNSRGVYVVLLFIFHRILKIRLPYPLIKKIIFVWCIKKNIFFGIT